MIQTNAIWFESCALKEIRRMDRSASSSASLHSSSSQLTSEQQALLNFDEVVALWYLVMAICYGFFRYYNSRFAIAPHFNRNSGNSNAYYEFSLIHWFILLIAIMGLANFLFSLSLLEAMDHKSSIGSKVLKLSYINMIFACLRHPCTMSLAILAPKVEFGSDRYYYYPANSAVAPEYSKSSTICLLAFAFAQFVLRLTENFMVHFCYGGRGMSETVKLVDLFDCVLDGIFLVQMTQSLYKVTIEISRDAFGSNRWQIWWKSRSLQFLWILYTIFVAISTVLLLICVSTFFRKSNSGNDHFVYIAQKAHDLADLVLLNGIAIVLKPNLIGDNQRIGNISDENMINYYLLRGGRNIDESDAPAENNHEEEGELVLEMTPAALATQDLSSPLQQEHMNFSTDSIYL